jgi:hypothetical protein
MKKWKLLFWFVAFFFTMEMLSIPFSDNLEVWDFTGVIFSGISLIPLYGYAYQVVIGSKVIAIIIFLLNAFGVGAGAVYGAVMLVSSFSLFMLMASTVSIGCSLIYIYPQFMYAFKSNALWASNA